jgi:hypothetical protein
MSYKVLILSTKPNEWCQKLTESISNSMVIYDNSISDSEAESLGFKNICNMSWLKKSVVAWDKAFLYLNRVIDEVPDYVWFIEDDVFSKDIKTIDKLIKDCQKYDYHFISNRIKDREPDSKWHWWKEDLTGIRNNTSSFNPICRLSKTLIIKILLWRLNMNRFMFHEIMFASICKDQALTLIDFNQLEEWSQFGTFRWRPAIDINKIEDNKIYHPVKQIY